MNLAGTMEIDVAVEVTLPARYSTKLVIFWAAKAGASLPQVVVLAMAMAQELDQVVHINQLHGHITVHRLDILKFHTASLSSQVLLQFVTIKELDRMPPE